SGEHNGNHRLALVAWAAHCFQENVLGGKRFQSFHSRKQNPELYRAGMPASPCGTPEHPEQVPGPPLDALAGEILQVVRRQVFIPHRAGHGDLHLNPCFVDYLLREIDEYSVADCIGACVGEDDLIVGKGGCEGHDHSSPCMPIENVWFSLILISRERFQISLMIAPSRICSMVRSWSNRRLNSLRIVS